MSFRDAFAPVRHLRKPYGPLKEVRKGFDLKKILNAEMLLESLTESARVPFL
jgi:hypothetical protein